MPSATEVPTSRPPVLEYAALLKELDDLIAQGKGDGKEAEALADQMDLPWYAMTPQERARMRGLSADQYALREGGPKRVEMSKEEIAKWQAVARDAYASLQAGDADSTLSFLRKPIPAGLPRHVIPFLQARCWERLGDLETALVFMKEAERHDPTQAASVLILLERLERSDELQAYAERIIADPASEPVDLYLAAVALLPPTRWLDDARAGPILRKIVPVLVRARAGHLALAPERREIPDLEVLVTQVLGFCYERLGDLKSALNVYDDVLARYPRDGGILMARGLALYETNQAAALRDLAAAGRLRVPSIWPYHILSRHALETGVPAEALRLALAASAQPGPDSVRAEVYETIAIAQAELGQPKKTILENFDRAVALDPGNDRVRQNRDLAASPPSPGQSKPVRWRQVLSPPPSVKRERLRRERGREITQWSDSLKEQRGDRIVDEMALV
jgi:tetratricopeptide (TPR) repeat protein